MLETLTAMSRSRGLDAFGVARPEHYKTITGHSIVHLLQGCRSILVYAMAIPHELYNRNETSSYTKVAFQYFDQLDNFTREVSRVLKEAGHSTFEIGSNRPVIVADGKFRGIVSLKHAAEAAGIGTIGKSKLLLSRSFGPRLRLGGLLTTAELSSNEPLEKPVCIKGCVKCIENCPYSALGENGIDFYACLNNAQSHPLMFMTNAVKKLPSWKPLNAISSFSYNTIGKNYSYLCFQCIVSCPLFKGGLKK